MHKSVHIFQHRLNPFRTNHQPWTGGVCQSELTEPSWQHSAFTRPQIWFSHMCPSHQALQGLHDILHSARSSQKTSTMDHIVCVCMWTVWGWVLHTSDATKPKCSAPSRREALLFHDFMAVPTDLASSTGRHTSYSKTNGLPALHSSCSRQPLSIICFPFQPSTSHSFNVSGGLKSICWLPGLCCWKQSRFC